MTIINAETILTRDPDLVSAEMDGDLVMMSVANGAYYAISGVGPRIWELLEQPISIAEIVKVITHEFEVDAERAQADAMTFAEQLVEMKLVSLQPKTL